jgi:hypothetical protein
MTTLYVRTTTLEKFRLVATEEWADEDGLINEIRGYPRPENDKMRCGTALHAILADPKAHYFPEQMDDVGNVVEAGYAYQGYIFSPEDIFHLMQMVGPGWCEKPVARPFRSHAGHQVVVTGTMDRALAPSPQETPVVVSDLKVRFDTPDAEYYDNSLQWRFYLLMSGAREFTYHNVQLDNEHLGNKVVKTTLCVNYYAHDGLQARCQLGLDRFLAWAELNDLVRFLTKPAPQKNPMTFSSVLDVAVPPGVIAG